MVASHTVFKLRQYSTHKNLWTFVHFFIKGNCSNRYVVVECIVCTASNAGKPKTGIPNKLRRYLILILRHGIPVLCVIGVAASGQSLPDTLTVCYQYHAVRVAFGLQILFIRGLHGPK